MGMLCVGGVDDEQPSLHVGDNDVGPDGDTGFGVQRDCQPLFAPGPDPPGVMRAVNGLGHQGGIPDHPLNTVKHNSHPITGR